MTPEQLEAIEGIGPKTVEKISLAVNNYFSVLERWRSRAPAVEGEEPSQEAAAAEAGSEAPVESESQEAAPSAEAEPAPLKKALLTWRAERQPTPPNRNSEPDEPCRASQLRQGMQR